ncbi:MAG: LptE family protein [Microbacter sp.]
MNKKGHVCWHRHWISGIALLFVALTVVSCSISYKFNGSSIDYSKIKTITIANFPNNAPLVYPPLAQNFNDALQNIFAQRTRLQPVSRNGDLQIDGEITGYDLTPLAIQSSGLAGETRLTLTVKVHFVNTKNEKEDFDTSFSASQTFSSTLMLNQVQDQLLEIIIKEIVEDIYNQTVAKW